ncbi:MAG TPA: HAMP domain-containing sensor histidine kinase [Candidatus Dormibacteraeota bacterium]|nr:HAMP domain-containing sensor histidine kinase [Candidatus Dormibacteraeota bacterium]
MRVAALATLIAGVIYIALAIGIVVLDVNGVNTQVDQELNQAITTNPRSWALISHTSPFLAWVVTATGTSSAQTDGAPTLPAALQRQLPLVPTPVHIGADDYRLVATQLPTLRGGAEYLVVGEETDFVAQLGHALIVSEAIASVPILLIIFLAAFAIGRRTAAPLERAHQRLLDFTADASHELRTPLSVIDAEVSLALMKNRTAGAYREALVRVSAESGRLRRLVEDLLWLARFDGDPKSPRLEIVDLGSLVANSVERFETLARSQDQTLQLASDLSSQSRLHILAVEQWIDRLLGVVLDNACHYTPRGGRIRVTLTQVDGRVELAIEDTGPGIAGDDLDLIFERFHRGTTAAGGSGLGLSIGNAIVKATGGRWDISRSADLGGARFAVRWAQRASEAALSGPPPDSVEGAESGP